MIDAGQFSKRRNVDCAAGKEITGGDGIEERRVDRRAGKRARDVCEDALGAAALV